MNGTQLPWQELFTIPSLRHREVKVLARCRTASKWVKHSWNSALSPKFCSWGQSRLVVESLALAADRPTSALALTLFRKLLNFPEPRTPYLQNEANRAATQGAAMRIT